MWAMRYSLDSAQCRHLEISSRREWLLTNGIGGYAMGTASGINTRRYHGHLIAAIRPPADRMLLLSGIEATAQSSGPMLGLCSNQYPGTIHPEGYQYLEQFEVGEYARWLYKGSGMVVEKRLALHPGKNACTITYRNEGDGPIQVTLRPLVSHKPHHENFHESPTYPQALAFPKGMTLVEQDGIELTLLHPGAQRIPVQGWYYRFEHAREIERGLNPRDDLYCPCELRYELLPGEEAVLVASSEGTVEPYCFGPIGDSPTYRLTPVLQDAAKRFLVKSHGRETIIAGYPWFTDWGRDTMIALPGLCLATDQTDSARNILQAFAKNMHQGLIPNRFLEDGNGAEYNTVDATLWFGNAVYLTLKKQWDDDFAIAMAQALESAVDWHLKGTLFGIKVDPADGLLTQGAEGVQLTWMDAKVGDWVVTPRHGKPVEVNGLWINLLRALEWLGQTFAEKALSSMQQPSNFYGDLAAKAEENFEKKFWFRSRGFYLDTADPDDASLRPNQLIPMALPFPAAKGAHAKEALEVISRHLLTAHGIRTLGPEESGYRGMYKGPLPELDASYHQGTVWPWLLGPYVTALVRLTGDRQEAKRVLKGAKAMLSEYGMGGIAEVYDGDEPQTPGGCPWQAWSIAEILRAWTEDLGGD